MDNDVGQSVIELGSTSYCRAYTGGLCVLQRERGSSFLSALVHSTFCVQVKFVLIVPMLQ